jgi:hypothetical protein
MLLFNIRHTAIPASLDHQMSADAHGNQGAKTMTKIAIVAAVALNFGITSGFGQFNPDFVKTMVPTVPSQDATADLGAL